jgi:hypothetical protein
MHRSILLLILITTLGSCYISRKVETPLSLKIDRNFEVNIDKPSDPKYIKESDADKYKQLFIDGIINELSNYNVTVISSEAEKYDLLLKIKELRVRETVNTSTVDDAASPYHGQSYSLHSCDAAVDFVLYRNGAETDKGWASVDKEEKLTNNRNVGDYILGSNKDGSEYRHKQLSDDIFEDLSQRAGRRTAARITKKLTKK